MSKNQAYYANFGPLKDHFIVKNSLSCFVGKGWRMRTQLLSDYLFPLPREPGDEATCACTRWGMVACGVIDFVYCWLVGAIVPSLLPSPPPLRLITCELPHPTHMHRVILNIAHVLKESCIEHFVGKIIKQFKPRAYHHLYQFWCLQGTTNPHSIVILSIRSDHLPPIVTHSHTLP